MDSIPDRRYLELLSQQFPTAQAAYTEIINLSAILDLPRGTEHFMSDIHGEHEAFEHILNNCSGVIRERVHHIFADELDDADQADLCTLIYYPREKLARAKAAELVNEEWYRLNLSRIVRLARYLSSFYTRSKVRKAMPEAYAYIIDELLRASAVGETSRHEYHKRIISSIIEVGAADDFISSLAALIKRLAVDRLHIVGDIFDRGPKADRILDRLMGYHSIDVQWGNHDIAWMGAAAGSEACIATVVRTCIRYGTLAVLESGYGISLRKLFLFAEKNYAEEGPDTVGGDEAPGAWGSSGGNARSAVEKAIDIIMLKLEGQLIARNPEFGMEDRLLLGAIDRGSATVSICGRVWPLSTLDFPTIDPERPYELTEEERSVLDDLVESFSESDRLKAHISFLFEHGSTYLIRNKKLLFHGCVPLEGDGSLAEVVCADGVARSGRAYLDWCDRTVRRAWRTGGQKELDWMWYLWCGLRSPFAGRTVKTFERAFVTDPEAWKEPQDPYFKLIGDTAVCERIFEEFGIEGEHRHIINGHTPIHASQGESPLKADSHVIVIDGGFCRAYHATTGIAGYTLIADRHGLRIKAHRPFGTIADALDLNADIMSESDRFERTETDLRVADTDTGERIRDQIAELGILLEAYRAGELAEMR